MTVNENINNYNLFQKFEKLFEVNNKVNNEMHQKYRIYELNSLKMFIFRLR